MEVLNTKDLAQDPRIRMIVYGGPGTGKTSIATTFPKPIAIVAKEEVPNQVSIASKGMPYIVVENWDDILEAGKYIAEHKGDYETVSIDTLTAVQEYAKDKLTLGGKKKLQFDDWSKLADMLIDLVRRFNSLGLHVVAQLHEVEEKSGDILVKRYDLSGQFKNKVSREFNLIAYLSQRAVGTESAVTARFRPSVDNELYGKTHYRNMPNTMDDPSFEKIYAIMDNEMNGVKNKGKKKNS